MLYALCFFMFANGLATHVAPPLAWQPKVKNNFRC